MYEREHGVRDGVCYGRRLKEEISSGLCIQACVAQSKTLDSIFPPAPNAHDYIADDKEREGYRDSHKNLIRSQARFAKAHM